MRALGLGLGLLSYFEDDDEEIEADESGRNVREDSVNEDWSSKRILSRINQLRMPMNIHPQSPTDAVFLYFGCYCF